MVGGGWPVPVSYGPKEGGVQTINSAMCGCQQCLSEAWWGLERATGELRIGIQESELEFVVKIS